MNNERPKTTVHTFLTDEQEIERLNARVQVYRDALERVASIEKQIRMAAYTSAGEPSRRDEMMVFSMWSGTLQRALTEQTRTLSGGVAMR